MHNFTLLHKIYIYIYDYCFLYKLNQQTNNRVYCHNMDLFFKDSDTRDNPVSCNNVILCNPCKSLYWMNLEMRPQAEAQTL